MNPLETLWLSLLVAGSAIGLSVIVRNLPGVSAWVQAGKKPWACNVCLPLYLCAFVVGAVFAVTHEINVLFSYLPGYALSYWVLEKVFRPPMSPRWGSEFMLPEDSGEDDHG